MQQPASKFRNLPLQGKDRTWANCAKRRPVTMRGEFPLKRSHTLEKCVGHSLKNFGTLRKLFTPPGIPSWLRACFALIGLAFIYPALPTCLVVYVQKSDFHLINVLCIVIVVKKCRLLCLAQVVFSYFVLDSSKIPLVLMTKVTHLRRLAFKQPDGINCVVRRVYVGFCPKTE